MDMLLPAFVFLLVMALPVIFPSLLRKPVVAAAEPTTAANDIPSSQEAATPETPAAKEQKPAKKPRQTDS